MLGLKVGLVNAGAEVDRVPKGQLAKNRDYAQNPLITPVMVVRCREPQQAVYTLDTKRERVYS